MPWDKTDKAFKTLINKVTTDSTNKNFYNEVGDFTINMHNSELWADPINSNPLQAVTDGVAEARSSFILTEDVSVPNQQCYYSKDITGRLKDWISDKYGSGFVAHIFDDMGTEVFPTDPSNWFFDYQTGILTFSGSTTSFNKPFRITGYRYIGDKGSKVQQDITLFEQDDVICGNTETISFLFDFTNKAYIKSIRISNNTNTKFRLSIYTQENGDLMYTSTAIDGSDCRGLVYDVIDGTGIPHISVNGSNKLIIVLENRELPISTYKIQIYASQFK